MKRTLFVCVLLCLATASMRGERQKIEYQYKLTKLSAVELGITCLNGGDPTGVKVGQTLIISCGR